MVVYRVHGLNCSCALLGFDFEDYRFKDGAEFASMRSSTSLYQLLLACCISALGMLTGCVQRVAQSSRTAAYQPWS